MRQCAAAQVRDEEVWASSTYGYRICDDTFPSDNVAAWSNLIVHALDQWELATDGLVTLTHDTGLTCADYSAEIGLAKTEMESLLGGGEVLTTEQNASLENYVKSLGTWTSINRADRAVSEIRLIDYRHLLYGPLKNADISPEVAKSLGFSTCVFRFQGCAVPSTDSATGKVTVDIMISGAKFLGDQLIIPEGKPFPKRDRVLMNMCSVDMPQNSAYELLVHESGHALGVTGRKAYSGTYLYSHSAIPYSVMNYDDHITHFGSSLREGDCAPHPFDIMVIYALYQKYSP